VSRLGAKASRARKEAKIRAVLTDPRVRTEIQEWIAPPPVPLPRRYAEPTILESVTISGDTLEARVFLYVLTTAIALGVVYALHYSFANP
jgi:hypothetical protein